MRRNLLFFDHEESLHEVYRGMFLNRPEFVVYTAKELDIAGNIVRRVPLELIIMSVPSVGFAVQDVLRFAKHANEKAKRRVILVSSSYIKEYARLYDIDATGALDALAKPFGTNDLMHLIDRVLPSKKMKIEIPDGF